MDANQSARQQLLIDNTHLYTLDSGKEKAEYHLQPGVFALVGKVKEMPRTRPKSISVTERYLPRSSQIL